MWLNLLLVIATALSIYALGFASGVLTGILRTFPMAKQYGQGIGYADGLKANVEQILLTKQAGGDISAEIHVKMADNWPDEIDTPA